MCDQVFVLCADKSTASPHHSSFFYIDNVPLWCICSKQSAICYDPSACFLLLREELQREKISTSITFNTLVVGQSYQSTKIHQLILVTISLPMSEVMFGNLP